MKCSGRWQALSLKILLLLFLFSFKVLGAEVELREIVTLNSTEVNLSDVARIEGSQLERELLSKVRIASVPPCREKEISKEEVARKIVSFLRVNGISLKEIRVSGPEKVLLKFPCKKLGGEHLKKLIESYLAKHYPDYELLYVPDVKVELPAGGYREVLNLESLGRRYGRFLYEIRSGGKVLKKIWLPVRVERKVKVVVAARPISRGERITLSDLKLQTVRESSARGGTDNLKLFVGAKARRDILPGEVLKESDVVPNFAVKRGMPVRVVYRKGALRVELLGIALQNGMVGNIIKVKNPSTGKVILCRVTGSGSVEFVSE